MDYVAELGKSFLFRDLPEAELKKLAAIAHQHSYSAGEKLISQGDEPSELLIILLGSVKVSRHVDNGPEEEIVVLASGSHLGEAAVVERDESRAVTAKAMEKTYVLGIDPEALEEVCERDAALGYHVYRAIARAIVRRTRGILNDVAYYKSLSHK